MAVGEHLGDSFTASYALSRGGRQFIPFRRPVFHPGNGRLFSRLRHRLPRSGRVHRVNPHGSYTGAMSYEHERELHCCSSRKLLSPSLLALPVSPCLPAATQNPLLRRSCYLCGRYRSLAVVGPVLDVCRLWIRAQVTLCTSSAAAQVLPSACRASSLVALSESRMVNLQGACCIRSLFTTSAVTSSCRTLVSRCLSAGD